MVVKFSETIGNQVGQPGQCVYLAGFHFLSTGAGTK